MALQNFYATRTSTAIGAADTTVTVDTPPTVATSGYVVLEPKSTSNREIISYTGVLGNQLTGVVRGLGGTTAKAHATQVSLQMNVVAEHINELQNAFNTFAETSNSWRTAITNISSVVYNGNRSYTFTSSANLTTSLSPGNRIRTTRTVAAPTQSTLLNGTNQYWNKTSPAGMTFTDDFVVGAWVKLSSYQQGMIISRFNGTSGWQLRVDATGQVACLGYNGSGGNYKFVQSYQSLPLNKWVHVVVQFDMSAITGANVGLSSTTNYIMFDGVDVPALSNQGGTNPTALIQAGNLEIGSTNGGTNPLPGKIAQAFVSSAKITQANVRTLISQGLTPALISTHSIVSAYSFDGTANDLNTTNANNLTAQGAATATNADSPFGGQAGGTIDANKDYGILQAISPTSWTVQVAEGCTIPTSGGVASISYAYEKSPYGFPGERGRWIIEAITRIGNSNETPTTTVWYTTNVIRQLTLPIGIWDELGYWAETRCAAGGSPAYLNQKATLSNSGTLETNPLLTDISGADVVGVNATRTEKFSKTIEYTNQSTEAYRLLQWVQANSIGNSNGMTGSRIWAIPANL